MKKIRKLYSFQSSQVSTNISENLLIADFCISVRLQVKILAYLLLYFLHERGQFFSLSDILISIFSDPKEEGCSFRADPSKGRKATTVDQYSQDPLISNLIAFSIIRNHEQL